MRGNDYDLDGRLIGASTTDPSSPSPLQSLTFGYDTNNSITAITNAANVSLSQSFGYDARKQVDSRILLLIHLVAKMGMGVVAAIPTQADRQTMVTLAVRPAELSMTAARRTGLVTLRRQKKRVPPSSAANNVSV